MNGLPSDHFTLTADVAALRATPDAPAPRAALLPVWDPYLMAYRRRERYLAPQHADCVFDKGGNGTSVALVGGRSAGVWDWSEDQDTFTLKVALFETAPKAVWREMLSYAERLATQAREQPFKAVRLLRCSRPASLTGGSQNLFRAPLAKADGTGEATVLLGAT